jgi:hypothetical protein
MMYMIHLVHCLALSQKKKNHIFEALYIVPPINMIITLSGINISPNLIAHTTTMLVLLILD